MMLPRRKFLKSLASGLFIPALPAIVRAQPLTLNDPTMLGTLQSAVASNGLLTGLLGYWKMDENIASGSRADATGNSWTAADTNNNVASIAGLISNGINISTQNKGLKVLSAIDSRAQTNPFSFSWWLNPSVGFNNNFGLTAFYGGTTWGWYVIENGAGALIMHALDDAGNDTTVSINQLVVGAWHHIVAMYEGNGTNKINLYLNAVKVSASLVGGQSGVTRGSNGLIIGNNQIFSAGQTGTVDEAGYWNRALSASDITQLYNSGAGYAFSNFTN